MRDELRKKRHVKDTDLSVQYVRVETAAHVYTVLLIRLVGDLLLGSGRSSGLEGQFQAQVHQVSGSRPLRIV